jgi:hypothetical protein
MRKTISGLILILLVLFPVGCTEDIHEEETGGVLLSVTDFDGWPAQVGVNAASTTGLVQVEEVEVDNIASTPGGQTSDLMDVELQSYEITFTRGGSGTRVPPPLVNKIFGLVEVGGNTTFNGLPILTGDQLSSPPLSDLLVENGSFDRETGLQRIVLNLHLRFFGRTLAGHGVQSQPANFTIEFVP